MSKKMYFLSKVTKKFDKHWCYFTLFMVKNLKGECQPLGQPCQENGWKGFISLLLSCMFWLD